MDPQLKDVDIEVSESEGSWESCSSDEGSNESRSELGSSNLDQVDVAGVTAVPVFRQRRSVLQD